MARTLASLGLVFGLAFVAGLALLAATIPPASRAAWYALVLAGAVGMATFAAGLALFGWMIWRALNPRFSPSGREGGWSSDQPATGWPGAYQTAAGGRAAWDSDTPADVDGAPDGSP